MRTRIVLTCVFVCALAVYTGSYVCVRSAFQYASGAPVFFNRKFIVDRVSYFGYYPLVAVDRIVTGKTIVLDDD